MTSNRKGRRSAVLLVVGAAVLGTVGGAAFAQGVLIPAGVAMHEGGEPAAAIVPTYPKNARGQTYGSVSDAVLPQHEPDLIRVRAASGKEGYVAKETLDEAIGAHVSSPAEAVAWQRRQDAATWNTLTIPVFKSDGTTQVGTFEVSRSLASDPAGVTP